MSAAVKFQRGRNVTPASVERRTNVYGRSPEATRNVVVVCGVYEVAACAVGVWCSETRETRERGLYTVGGSVMRMRGRLEWATSESGVRGVKT